MEKIQIRSPATTGGARLILISAALLLLFLLFSVLLAERITFIHGILFMLCLLGVFTGWAKLAEPLYFLECDEQGVRYHHRYGSWLLPWQGFLYSAVPALGEKQVGYIGFRVTDYDAFLESLPLRLAVRIMTEQQSLFFEAVRQGCSSGQCAGELLATSDQFRTKKQRYDGIKALFAHRMQKFSSVTGYDVFVPVAFNAEESNRICQLLNRTRLQLIQNTVT